MLCWLTQLCSNSYALLCPADFVDSGAMAALVPMLLQRQEAAREAALEAISALCSFNQAGCFY